MEQTKIERPDEWDVQFAAGKRDLARARVRLAALEQYRARFDDMRPAQPPAERAVTEIALDDERLVDLQALDDELQDARIEHDKSLLRLRMIAQMREERMAIE